MLVIIANREDLGQHCFSRPFCQATSAQILELFFQVNVKEECTDCKKFFGDVQASITSNETIVSLDINDSGF